jgi:hypothetical protein
MMNAGSVSSHHNQQVKPGEGRNMNSGTCNEAAEMGGII